MSLPADRGRPRCLGEAERSGAGSASAALLLPGYSTGVEPVLPVQNKINAGPLVEPSGQLPNGCQMAAQPFPGH